MFKLKNAACAVVLVFNCFLTGIFAQTPPPKPQARPSYEVVLQTIVGSNAANVKADVPPPLSGIVKKLKTNYSYSNYRLNSTFLQRIAESGTIELKSASSEKTVNAEVELPVFSEWTLNDLKYLPDADGRKMFQFEGFRFGQRVPVISNWSKNEIGKNNPVYNYEQIGLTVQRSSLPENVPTIVGSLTTINPDELMFLVLTVKSAE